MSMWYGVSLLIEGVHVGFPREESLWEDQIVLIRAESEAEAEREGERLGRAGDHEYVSAAGILIRWTFRQVESVCEIDAETLESGTEVFSRFLRTQEVDSMLTPFSD